MDAMHPTETATERRSPAGTSASLDLAVPATADRVPFLREAARQLAEFHGAPCPEDVALAVDEACTNAVVHAYAGLPPGAMRLIGECGEGKLRFIVEDQGTGLAPHPNRRGFGLGLPIIAHVAQRFEVSGGAGVGTRVTMDFGLPPVPMPSQNGASPGIGE